MFEFELCLLKTTFGGNLSFILLKSDFQCFNKRGTHKQKPVTLFMELQDQKNNFPISSGDEYVCGEWLVDMFLLQV